MRSEARRRRRRRQCSVCTSILACSSASASAWPKVQGHAHQAANPFLHSTIRSASTAERSTPSACPVRAVLACDKTGAQESRCWVTVRRCASQIGLNPLVSAARLTPDATYYGMQRNGVCTCLEVMLSREEDACAIQIMRTRRAWLEIWRRGEEYVKRLLHGDFTGSDSGDTTNGRPTRTFDLRPRCPSPLRQSPRAALTRRHYCSSLVCIAHSSSERSTMYAANDGG